MRTVALILDLVKFPEDVIKLVRRNSDPGVFARDMNAIGFVVRTGHTDHLHDDMPFFCKLDGVIQRIMVIRVNY